MEKIVGDENVEESSETLPVQLEVMLSKKIDMNKNPEKIGWIKNILWRVLNFLMAMFFALAAYVQLNDPDPLVWMLVYSIPGVLCLSIVFRIEVQDHYVWQALATADFFGSLAGAVYLATLIKPHMEKASISNPLVLEEGREMSGLIIIMLWIGISKIVSWFNQRQDKVSSLALWVSVTVLCLVPFALWAYCYRTLNKNALPGHCKDML